MLPFFWLVYLIALIVFSFMWRKESIWPGLCLLKCIASIVFIILDASYVDPLGPQIQRPKTAARTRTEEDEFADEELGDDLLPEWCVQRILFSGISDICQDTKFVCIFSSPKILYSFPGISFHYALLYFVLIHNTFRDNAVYSKLFISLILCNVKTSSFVLSAYNDGKDVTVKY